MPKGPRELRELAADGINRARQSGPRRARQLRLAAAAFTHQALKTELYEHGKTVGRTNVTVTSFRAHLRARRQITTG